MVASATGGAGRAPEPSLVRNWSLERSVTPSFAKFSLPPVWSGWTCVFTMKRMGPFDTCLMAATIFSVNCAYCVSTMNTPSGPTRMPIVPPDPSSV